MLGVKDNKNCRERSGGHKCHTPVPPGLHALNISQSMKAYSMGTYRKVYKSFSPHFIKCSTYVHFKDEPLTRLCRLPPWLSGETERLRIDKNNVAVGKVDLVFCSPLWYSTFWFITTSTYFLKKKKSLMQTVEKFPLKLAVKNKDSCLSLCTPLCFSHPVL